MHGGIGDNVVNVVTPFPPAEGQAANKISDEYTDDCVDLVIMCDSHMACVMSKKNELMPSKSQAHRTQRILLIDK
jgi:hypothetical protein